jgi:hypothetical protein
MEVTRARMQEQAAAVGGSFNIGEAIGGAASAQAAPATAGQTLGMLGNAAGALQGGAGGIGGALSSMGASAGMAAAGPIVAAIMQIVQLVTSIVPEEGQEGLLDGIHNMVMEFMGDIGELPQVLADFMSDTIREGIPAMMQIIPELVEGLISAIPQLIVSTVEQFPLMIGGLLQMLLVGIPKAILNGIGAVFSLDLWKGLVKALIEGFKEFFAPIFGNKKTGEKGAFGEGGYFDKVFVDRGEKRQGERSSLFAVHPDLRPKGSRASGDDFIPQTGLYLMHRGESVAGNGRTLPAGARSGGQPTTIVVQGSLMASMEDLAAAIRDAKRRGVSFG